MATVQKSQVTTSRSKSAQVRTAPPTGAADPTIEMIAARAYEIWQEGGCQQGRDAENWYQAERELRARRAS